MRAKRTKDGIYKRGDVYWLQYRGTRRSLRTTDEKAAQLAAREVQRRAADPSYAAAHETSLTAACEAFLEQLGTGGNRSKAPAPETIEMYEYHCGHFCRVLGADRPLATIDAKTVDHYITTRRSETIGKKGLRTVGAHTVAKELGTLRQVLRLALRRGTYHRPLEQVLPATSAPEYKPIERSLTEEQIPALLAAFEKREDRAATCAFIVGLGADWCAVGRAKLEDFKLADDGTGTVLVRGSKTARRFAPVPVVEPFTGLVERARAYLEEHGRFPEWSNKTRDLELACQAAGLPRVTVRDLRRTFGRILRAHGTPPHLIGGMLRHSDSRMAELVYARLEPADLGRLVAEHTSRRIKPTQKRRKLPARDRKTSQKQAV